ncbi:MAG: transcription-repair coupling factor [Christensenellales bacterium]
MGDGPATAGEKVIDSIMKQLQQTSAFLALADVLRGGEFPCSVFGMPASFKSFLLATAAKSTGSSILVITDTEQAAETFYQELLQFQVEAAYYPVRDMRFLGANVSSREMNRKRAAVLANIGSYDVVVSSLRAFALPLMAPKSFQASCIVYEQGQKVSMQELSGQAVIAGYERVPLVEEEGQFSLRGGVFDIYMVGGDSVRLEFFGDEIESVRLFDPQTQRSVAQRRQVKLIPAYEAPMTPEDKRLFASFLRKQSGDFARELEAALPEGMDGAEYIPCFTQPHSLMEYMNKPLVFLDEPLRLREAAEVMLREHGEYCHHAKERGTLLKLQETMLFSLGQIQDKSGKLLYLEAIRSRNKYNSSVGFMAKAAMQYHGRFAALAQDLQRRAKKGETTLLCAGSRKQGEKLSSELLNLNTNALYIDQLRREIQDGETLVLPMALKSGFQLEDGLLVLGEQELFGASRGMKKAQGAKKAMAAFIDLQPGDYIVHDQHGIGQFEGIEQVNVEGNCRDYLIMRYAGGDKLKLPTEQLNRVQKYIGSDHAPRLSKLGGSDWSRTRQKVRESVRELAFSLVELYARRHSESGFAFSPDTPYQREFEDLFPYEETPDQLTCIEEIKRDMELPRPMDRLLCGDVGYGKTEVVLRAAFKAVMDSKQVAVLVPTTILAQQHYATINRRFEGFPVRANVLSRFKPPREQKDVMRQLSSGELDMVVGTHKLLNKNIMFKDLGLLIVDEEHRFGVGQKEAIKHLKNKIDVLSMSATPIPRTLSMSLSGIRDMSLIETPPEQRFPVQTYVMEYDQGIIADAVYRELERGGQVFFVYNQVANIELFLYDLKQLLPGVRIAVAHGQMSEVLLEKTMLAFYEHEYDVLLCSTIIESGLDVPNVNTLIVCDADRMGLSQLYQLRGRVGRSDRRAYAYFMFKRNKALSEIAQKRLIAIRDFVDLGSGFRIAMRDLEIRGAGDILGPQQHGHLSEVGYEMYCRIVEEEVAALQGRQVRQRETDTVLDLAVDANIPDSYIKEQEMKLDVYKQIASISSSESLGELKAQLTDRFSVLPRSVENLMKVALLRSLAQRCYIISLSYRKGVALLRLEKDAPLDPHKVMALLGKYRRRVVLSAGEKPAITVRNLSAEGFLQEITDFIVELTNCITEDYSV